MSSYYEKLLATGEVKCIDEEVPFEIPASWSWARLTHVTYLIEDCPHSTAKDEGKGYPLVRTPNICFGFLQLNGVHRVSEKVYNQRNVRAVPQKDDLIFAREAPAGNIAVIQNEKVCLGQRTVLLRPITDCILPQYLAYYVLAPSSQQNLVEKSSGTTVAHVNLSDFRPYLIAVPPIDEQKQIVNKLIELLSLIDKYNCYGDKLAKLNNEIYTLLKKSILQEAIQGKLVPQIIEDGTAYELLEQIKAEKQNLVKEGKLKKSALATSVIFRGDDNRYYEKIGKKCVDITEEIPFPIPANWQWVRIRDVFQLNPKNEADDETLAAFIPMEKIRAGYKSDFTFDLVKWGNIKKGFIHFANGDVAFAKITPCFQNRKSAIFHDLPNGIGAGTTELKVLRPYGNTIGRWYLLYFLESPYFIDEATFKGTANQQRIVVGYLENKLFPLPPKEEQQRIVAQIEKLFEQLH